MKVTKQERQESVSAIRSAAPLGGLGHRPAQIHAIVDSVARSGMSRRIRFYAQREDGEMVALTYHMGRVLGWNVNAKGLLVSGCGMDMVFHALDTLARTVWTKEEQEEFERAYKSANFYRYRYL